MKPRHTPTYKASDYPEDILVGYVGDFDVYIDFTDPCESEGAVTVVAARPRNRGSHNFDVYSVRANTLEVLGTPDLHLDLHHMCLLYALCVEQGILDEGKDHGHT